MRAGQSVTMLRMEILSKFGNCSGIGQSLTRGIFILNE